MFQEQLLKSFRAEQTARHSQFKQNRARSKAQTRDAGIQCNEKNPVAASPTADASTQCDDENAATRSRTSDVGVQTDFFDVMPDLKEQIRHLSQIVAELTALKSKPQENVNEGSRGSLLSELLSGSFSDITTICPDSSENCSTASADPLPGLQSPSAVMSPSQGGGGGACSQDPLTFLDFIPCSPLLKPLVPKNDPNNLVKSSPVP